MIHATGLRHTYPNGVVALDGVDLRIARGERVAIVGPNGAGKTTLMLRLNGLLRGHGDCVVDGGIGLIFQDPDDQLFMPTVREDVAFGPLNRRLQHVPERVEAALHAVRMHAHADRAPHQLSLGQKRRVAIATVLAMDPNVLVLDEPSANLDPRTRRELTELLEQLDRTLLVVTHDLPLAARLCERTILLSAGRVVADGPTLDLLADEQLLAAHDLELPDGYALTPSPRRAWSRSRPAASAWGP